MGVMACSRNNCDNIMCDTYIPDIGYICRECQKEFKSMIKVEQTADEYAKILENFMNTNKANVIFSKQPISIDEFFNKYTK